MRGSNLSVAAPPIEEVIILHLSSALMNLIVHLSTLNLLRTLITPFGLMLLIQYPIKELRAVSVDLPFVYICCALLAFFRKNRALILF